MLTRTPRPVPSLKAIALHRMAFGPSPDDLTLFQSLGSTPEARLRQYIDYQLDPNAIPDTICDDKLALANLTTLNKSLTQLWQDHSLAADALLETDPTQEANAWKLRIQPMQETEKATWLRAVYSRRQLLEVLADFWHNHFNVNGDDGRVASVFVHYDREVIRKHCLGNFREFLEAVAKSPAMLFYLDNGINQSSNPNENYARELFELHTLGSRNYLGTKARDQVPGYAEGNSTAYVDGDVYEAARCFTGWRVAMGLNGGANTGEFEYYEPWHDRFQKIILGRALPELQGNLKDGHDVLDILAAHPGTSRAIARKLCQRFIGENPPKSIVDAAASVFLQQQNAPDQLKQVLRTILLSTEFKTIFRKKMKRPFDAVAAFLRATEADFFPSDQFLYFFYRTGQELFRWLTPDGYPDSHKKWGNSSSLLERWRLLNLVCLDEFPEIKINFSPAGKGSLLTPRQLSSYWSKRLLGYAMPPASLQEIEDILAQGRDPLRSLTVALKQERLPTAVALIGMSPDFQWK